MKEALDKMMTEDEGGAPGAGGDVDLSSFDDKEEEPDEDTKLTDALSSVGYMVDPDKLLQIKDILKAEPMGEEGLPPMGDAGAMPPAKPKSKMDALFGGK